MAIWIRQDINIDTVPDFMAAAVDAGGWVLVAFQTLLRVVKDHGENGRIKRKFVSGSYLASRSLFTQDLTPQFTRAVEVMLARGIITHDETHIIIPHWEQYQPDPMAAKRKRRQRERDADRDATVPAGHGQSRDVTVGHGCHGDNRDRGITGQDMTGHDKTAASQLPPTPGRGCEAVKLAWQQILVPAGAPPAPEVADWDPETVASVEARIGASGLAGVEEAMRRAARSMFLVRKARCPLTLPRLFDSKLWSRLQAGNYDDQVADGDHCRSSAVAALPVHERERLAPLTPFFDDAELEQLAEQRRRASQPEAAGGPA